MPRESETKRVERESNKDFVARQFADLGIEIEDYPEIANRLMELNERPESHFGDAVNMAEIIDLLWNKIELKTVSKEKLKLCALLHDIGKSGPAKADQETRQVIQKLFDSKLFKDSRSKPIREALREEGIAGREQIEMVLENLGIDIDQERMIDFWRRHADWTYDVLKNNQGGAIDEEVIAIASSHHILDGKNPANLPLDKIPEGAKTIEVIDGYQTLTLVDKYQAYRGRSAYSHEEAIEAILTMIQNSNLGSEVKNNYLRIVGLLADSKEVLEQILKKRNG